MHTRAFFITLGALLVCHSADVWACVCDEPPSIERAFERSELAFYGEVTAIAELTITATPIRAFKGQKPDGPIEITLPSSDCVPVFRLGSRYMLYTWRLDDGSWQTGDLCEAPNKAQYRSPISPFTAAITNVSPKETKQRTRVIRAQRRVLRNEVSERIGQTVEDCRADDLDAAVDLRYRMTIRPDGEFVVSPLTGHASIPILENEPVFRECFEKGFLNGSGLSPFDGQDIDITIHATAERPPFIELTMSMSGTEPKDRTTILGWSSFSPARLRTVFATAWEAQQSRDNAQLIRSTSELSRAGNPAAVSIALSEVEPQTTEDQALRSVGVMESFLTMSDYDHTVEYARHALKLTQGMHLRARYVMVVATWAKRVESGEEVDLLTVAKSQGWDAFGFRRLALGATKPDTFTDWAALATLWSLNDDAKIDAGLAAAISLRTGIPTPILSAQMKELVTSVPESRMQAFQRTPSIVDTREAARSRATFAENAAILLAQQVTPEPTTPVPWTPPRIVEPKPPEEFAVINAGALIATLLIVVGLGVLLRRFL